MLRHALKRMFAKSQFFSIGFSMQNEFQLANIPTGIYMGRPSSIQDKL